MVKRLPSWVVSDSFWKRVEPLIPQPERDKERNYRRKVGGGRKPIPYRRVFEGKGITNIGEKIHAEVLSTSCR